MRTLTRRQRRAAIALVAVALCFLTLDLGGGSLRDAHSGVRGAFGSLYRGTDTVVGPVRRWVQGVPSAGSHESEIRRLRAENEALRARLDALGSDTRTARQLATLQRAAASGRHRIVPGRVIAFGPGQGFDWTVTVDAGSDDGVRAGQTVTEGAALVGRVLHADAHSAVVLLAADPGSGVGARDARSGELGVATGAGRGGFTFAPLNPDASLRVGDALVTGPVRASSFVAGLSVGRITAVRHGADGTQTATVAPTSSATSVDLLGVITATTTSTASRPAVTPGTSGSPTGHSR
ncbi:rod shape-determining protein MreC [Jatrophihabitans endophyticus]|uniref:Cell shape-determining protein MreC n=1 Tax=Jatrophihabitans endophyticus TaxID=1206085 RepID=A0A1M5UQA2_9ACTN|nr:rod shape-determining protein MreC [Jatrophihabitans endophyticus]SHH65129.1 rod shape-determining protein MreC [Jatrophihabitans endophyticus]